MSLYKLLYTKKLNRSKKTNLTWVFMECIFEKKKTPQRAQQNNSPKPVRKHVLHLDQSFEGNAD